MSISKELRIQKTQGKPKLVFGSSGSAAWEWVNAEQLKSAVVSATAAGGALLFGRTRDGGALSIVVYYGDECSKIYVGHSEELRPKLQEIEQKFDDLVRTASSGGNGHG